MRRSIRFTALFLMALLTTISFNGIQPANSYFEEDSLVAGPHVDEVIYRVMRNNDQRILALQTGEIEMDTSYIFGPATHYDTLNADPDIAISNFTRNGYGQLTINCRDYPLNISGLRRAFAYAYDKTLIPDDVFDGFSIVHDSLVPQSSSWCIEDKFDWHYYSNQSDIGNQILDDLGFDINGTTGFRHAPNGNPFNITIEYAPGGIYGIVAYRGVDALHSLHINASTRCSDFLDYKTRVDNHGDYDMVFYGVNFNDNDVDWLAYEFWSDNANVVGQNPSNFRNNTYDGWRNQLLYGTTYEEVYEAASEMQKILQYCVPKLVVYEDILVHAYRNDQYTGHVTDISKHIAGPWSTRNMHLLNGSLGGAVSIAIKEEPTNFNVFLTENDYSDPIMDNLWPSLFKRGPDHTPIPDIAEIIAIETHSDNFAVADGHIRFTIDIIQNATWSDGTPLTGDDVAFSFTYAFESGYYGNPAVNDLLDLFAAYSPASSTVIIEFSTESYWHFANIAYDYIIPKHIFNNSGGIGYEGWNTWNPVVDPTEPYVNCGPFIFSDYEEDDYFKIVSNPLFYYPVVPHGSTTTTASTTTSTTINQTTTPGMDWPLVVGIALVTGSGIVITYFVVIRIQKKKE